MRRSWILLCLAACSGAGGGSAPASRDVELIGHAQLSELLWEAESEPGPLPLALPWSQILYVQHGDLVCADEATGRVAWRLEVSTSGLQAGACRDTIVLLEKRRLRTVTKEGKVLAYGGTVPDGATLLASPGRVYIRTPEIVAAYDPVTLATVWQWTAPAGVTFRNLLVADDRVAVEYSGEEMNRPETALLHFESGQVRYRFLGRGIGWHGNRFFVARDWTREVWIWDAEGGGYLDHRRLDSFDGRVLQLIEGRVLYSGVNRYFSEPAFRVTPQGGAPAPQEVRSVREVQLENEWRRPLAGHGRLHGLWFADVTRDTVRVRWGWDGAMLFEVRAAAGVHHVTFGPRAMALLTNDGRVLVYRVR